jgi:hypothetical protein
MRRIKFGIWDLRFGICRNAAGFTLIEVILIAYFLGLEKLEELAAQTTGSISAEAKAAVSGYGDYEREVVVTDVNCDDLSTSESGSGCRKVTVTVYHSRFPNGVSLVSLRTSY